LIFGDMNIDTLSDGYLQDTYVDMLNSLGVRNVIHLPTRISVNIHGHTTSTSLDHILTNVNVFDKVGTLPESISDHRPTYGTLSKCCSSGRIKPIIESRFFSFQKAIAEIALTDWNDVCGGNSADIYANAFQKKNL
jgi:hypothetical protein